MQRLQQLDILAVGVGATLGACFAVKGAWWFGCIGAVLALWLRVRWAARSLTATAAFLVCATLPREEPRPPFDAPTEVEITATVLDGPRRVGESSAYRVEVEAVDDRPMAFDAAFYWDGPRVRGRFRVFVRCSPPAPREFFRLPPPGPRAAAASCSAREDPTELAAPRGLDAVRDAATTRRLAIEARLLEVLPARAGIPIAMITGTRGYLWPSETRAHQRAGTAHLLAISGLHFSVLAGIAWAIVSLVLRRIPRIARSVGARRASAGFVLATMFGYLLLVGAPVSAMRAFVAFAYLACALMLGRRPSGLVAVGLAAACLLLPEPRLIDDLGFQLSFAATFAIVLFWARRPRVLEDKYDFDRVARRRVRALGAFVLMSWCATAATLPLVTAAFGELHVAAFFTNLVAVPLVSSLIFPAYLLGLAVHVVLPPVGGAVLQATSEAMLRLTIALEQVCESPYAVVATGSPAPWWTLLLLVVTLVAIADRCRPRAVAVWGVTLATVVFAMPPPPAGGRVHFIPVGQGDATLLQTADRAVLVDAGGRLLGRDPGRHIVVPYLRRLGIRRLDAIVVTHADTDHAQGVAAVLEEIEVGEVITEPTDRFGDLEIVRALEKHGSRNERSLLVRWTIGGATVLLTGDIEAEAEAAWVRHDGRPIDILKVAHHGSKTSSSAAFLDAAAPVVAVVSAGRWNRFGHPAEVVRDRLTARAIPIFDTSAHGLIVVDIAPNGELAIRQARAP